MAIHDIRTVAATSSVRNRNTVPMPYNMRSRVWYRSVVSISGKMARPEGFEPPTPKFVAWCSIQLSYGRKITAAFQFNFAATGCFRWKNLTI